MKQVLFYTDTPNVGGAEKHMLLLATHLNNLGVKVSMAYGQYSQVYKMHDAFEKVCENVFVLKAKGKHDPKHRNELRKILNEYEFDLAHLHLWNPGACRYAFFEIAKKGIPIVTSEHDPFELSGVKKLIKKMCLAKTARTIVVSEANYGLLDHYYKFDDKRLELVHNGIEIGQFLDTMDKANIPVQNGSQVITCIAELHPRKGHKYLFDAFRRLQSEVPNTELVLVGTGPAEEQIKELSKDIPNVHFLGWRKDVPQILNASDIFVLPSMKEAFGQVIIEAMASGVAVIATDNGGPKDIIKDGITGYLVTPGSSQSIYEKLSVLLKNPGQKKSMEKAALEIATNEFTAKRMAQKTFAVYEKVW